MIPSSPRRTWAFLLLSSLAYFVPGLLVPAAWAKTTTYLLLSDIYQSALVVAGFWYGPAICRALVLKEVVAGPLREAVDRTMAELGGNAAPARPAELPVTLAEHPAPFVVTAGLLPRHSQVFLSSALAERLGERGLHFLLARALAHGGLSQRLAAVLPVVALTVMLPDAPTGTVAWLGVAGFLAAWLAVHWFFELRADFQAAKAVGPDAVWGLQEVLAAGASPAGWLSAQPPLRWRLLMVGGA